MATLLNNVARYFDLQSARRMLLAQAHGAGGQSPAPILPQYIALVAGVIVEPFLHYYIEHGSWSLTFSKLIGRVIFGTFIGIIAFPGVYKQAFDPSKPLFVQLCAIFSSGIGWQSLIDGGSKLTGITA
jgi:hypothetical protein